MYSLTRYFLRPPSQCPPSVPHGTHTHNYRLCFARPKRQLGPRLLVLLQSEALPQRGLRAGEQAVVKGVGRGREGKAVAGAGAPWCSGA